jgi:hypothetical protein
LQRKRSKIAHLGQAAKKKRLQFFAAGLINRQDAKMNTKKQILKMENESVAWTNRTLGVFVSWW